MVKSAEFRGGKVQYSDRGKGRAIVLLHGFLESSEIFSELTSDLARSYRVISIDLPGHGGTPSLGYTHTMEFMAECVKSVLDSIGLRKYVMIGHSMGGYVALAFAEKFPQQLAGFGLFHSTALPDSEERKADRLRLAEIVRNDHTKFVSDLIPRLFAPENRTILSDKVEKARVIALATPRDGIVAALLGMKDRPSREHVLKQAECPVLFIIGKQDVILAWDNLMYLTGLPKKSVQVVMEHAGHMGFYEAPADSLKVIRKFAGMCYR